MGRRYGKIPEIRVVKNTFMKWKQEKVIVFGGSGFLGHAIIRYLLAKGCVIKSFQRSPAPDLEKFFVRVVRGDIRNREEVIKACQGCTAVIHAASIAGYWGPYKEYHSINVEGAKNVLEACKMNGISRLVYTSSSSVAYNPVCNIEGINEQAPYPSGYLSHYQTTKALAEKHVLGFPDRQLSAISLRPHLIWGVGDRYLLPEVVKRAREKRLVQVGDGKNIIDLAHVYNVAHAHVLALEFLYDKPNFRGTYFITDRNPVNMWDWLGSILQKCNLPGPANRISVERAWRIAKLGEMAGKLLPVTPPLTRFLAGHFAYSHFFDTTAAERDLGYKPVVDPAEAMNETIEWLKNI